MRKKNIIPGTILVELREETRKITFPPLLTEETIDHFFGIIIPLLVKMQEHKQIKEKMTNILFISMGKEDTYWSVCKDKDHLKKALLTKDKKVIAAIKQLPRKIGSVLKTIAKENRRYQKENDIRAQNLYKKTFRQKSERFEHRFAGLVHHLPEKITKPNCETIFSFLFTMANQVDTAIRWIDTFVKKPISPSLQRAAMSAKNELLEIQSELQFKDFEGKVHFISQQSLEEMVEYAELLFEQREEKKTKEQYQDFRNDLLRIYASCKNFEKRINSPIARTLSNALKSLRSHRVRIPQRELSEA